MRKSVVLKEAVLFALIQVLLAAPNHAFFWHKAKSQANSADDEPIINVSNREILKYSHVAYRAMGGFTGVKSYSVLITCINGKISVLNSIHDPKVPGKKSVVRKKSNMNVSDYLALWDGLRKQRIFNVQNAPKPNMDILDEFTFAFDVQAGDQANQFDIYGLSRPEGARYFAIKSLIDEAGNMASLWDQHQALVRR